MNDWSRKAALDRIHDEIAELIQPRKVREPVRREGCTATERHGHTLQSLIAALHVATRPGADVGQVSGGKSFESRPAARLDPIDVLARITKQSREWAQFLGSPRHHVVKALSAVKGAAASASDSDLARLDNAVWGWWSDARVATGFDPQPFTLNQSCPLCGKRNALVARGEGLAMSASCSHCGQFWDREQLGILGQMIAASSSMETLAAPRTPKPAAIGRGFGTGRDTGDHDVCRIANDNRVISGPEQPCPDNGA